ncbi:MAG: acyltransferase family protein [Roseiarcus sp.]
MNAEAKYRPEIDGLRAIAVIPVVLYHAGFAGFRGGFLGVDVFFVISGYLITRLINAEMERGAFSLVAFYERRVRRILPALYLVVAASMPFAWLWFFPNELRNFASSVVAVALFGSNVYFNQEIDYFTDGVDLWPLIHTWSLAVEEQFYAAFPLLLLALRRGGPKWVVTGVAALSALSLLWAQWTAPIDPQSDFYLPQFRAWELGAGALIALARPERSDLGPWLPATLAGFGALLLLFSFVFAPRNLAPSLWSLVPVGGTALLIAFATPNNFWGGLLAARPLVAVGLVSYSAYLWHQPLFAFARFRFDAQPASSAMLLLSVVAFVLAYASWRFVERPFRDRRRFSRTAVFAMAIVVGVALIAAGRFIAIEHGLPGRMAPVVGADEISAYRKHCLGTDGLDPAALAQMSGCRLGVRNATPDFLLIGDSHAAAIADGVDAVAKRAGRSGILVAQNSCFPIPELVRTDDPPSWPTCRRQHDALLDLVDRLGVRLVLMHARWDSLDDKIEIDRQPGAGAVSAAEIRTRLLRTLTALASRNVKVVILTSSPTALDDVPEFLARKLRYGVGGDIEPQLRAFLFDNRTAFKLFSDPEVRRYATVIDLYPFFCRDGVSGRCAVADGSRPYYFDRDHLSLFGSMALAPLLAQAFE